MMIDLECHSGPVLCYVVPAGCFVGVLALAYALWVCARMYMKRDRQHYEDKTSELVSEALLFCEDLELLPPSKAWEATYIEADETSRTGHLNVIFNRDGTVLGSGSDQERSYVIYGKFDSNTSKVKWLEVERGVLKQENTYDIQGLLLDNEDFFLDCSKHDPLITVCEGHLQKITDRTLVCRNIIEGEFWTSRGVSGNMVVMTEHDTSMDTNKSDVTPNVTDLPCAFPLNSNLLSAPSALKAITFHSSVRSMSGIVDGEVVSATEEAEEEKEEEEEEKEGPTRAPLCAPAELKEVAVEEEEAAEEAADGKEPDVEELVSSFLAEFNLHDSSATKGKGGAAKTFKGPSAQEPSFRRFKAVVGSIPERDAAEVEEPVGEIKAWDNGSFKLNPGAGSMKKGKRQPGSSLFKACAAQEPSFRRFKAVVETRVLHPLEEIGAGAMPDLGADLNDAVC